jgi:flagellin-specific chaperone FliS
VYDPDAFLKQEVESASPARLRWLLLRKAVSLTEGIEHLLAEGRKNEVSQWWLRIQEILVELLDGVTDRSNPAAEATADLYVFLLKTSRELLTHYQAKLAKDFLEILKMEQQTWELFLSQQNPGPSGDPPPGRNSSTPATHLPFAFAAVDGGLSLEA